MSIGSGDEPRGEPRGSGDDIAAEPDRRAAEDAGEEPERSATAREQAGDDRDADRVNEGARETPVLAGVLRIDERRGRVAQHIERRPVAAHSLAAGVCWSGSPWTAR